MPEERDTTTAPTLPANPPLPAEQKAEVSPGVYQSETAIMIPPDAPPSSQNMIGQYMVTVGLYSGAVILLLLTFLWFIKKKPVFLQRFRTLIGVKTPPPPPQPKLQLEEAMPVDADKHLLIVRCEGERFLVSSGAEGLRFMTKLDDGHNTQQALMHQLMEQGALQGMAQQAGQMAQPITDAEGAKLFMGHGTIEDASGIRGKAIVPTETGDNDLKMDNMGQFSSAFRHTMKDMLKNVSNIKGNRS
jgi:hypothetical protein